MIQNRSSVYRYALQVSPERIARLSDVELNELMGQLLKAQAYRCSSPINEIRINTEVKASDDGCDGWSARPENPDEWLGTADTCWQFKAGKAGTPARLRGEVIKSIPKDTLSAGGHFVVVASGSTNGKRGEDARVAKLIREAQTADIPATNIQVIGSERLTNWLNQHPAIATYWAGRPSGLWTLDEWINSDEHQVSWQATAERQAEIAARQTDLDLISGDIYHLHIQGPPGVGKTRFALELCRNAVWNRSVVYIRDASDIRLFELIDGVVREGVQLLLVADEIQKAQLSSLRDTISRSNGRVRLITIGHCSSPDPARIPALQIRPLDNSAMAEVVKGWHPGMPPEHVDFTVRFADGYVRLAKLAANAVAHNPVMNVRDLLNRDEIQIFLDRMLGGGNRRPLHVVAVLTSVGWTGDKQIEGETIAHHFDLSWDEVRYAVEEFNNRFGIAPRGGRYRYISPTPLGIHLAIEAWNTYPDKLRSLPDVLPNGEAKEAYYKRLQSISSNPQSRDFAREELNSFFQFDDFLDAEAVKRWSALSAADPDQAARNLLRALSGMRVEDRKKIEREARRYVVRTLVGLAWRSSSFHPAVKALALLAEAENETWANNATGEFVDRFQIFLGGTAVPYLDRLPLLDELISEGSQALYKLVIKALSRVGNGHETRIGNEPVSDEVPELEWHPSSGKDHLTCVRSAVTKLLEITLGAIPDLQGDLVLAAQEVAILLLEAPIRDQVASFFIAIKTTYPEAREPLRRIIADVLNREKEYWKTIPVYELAEIERLHKSFEDTSITARLLQYVGPQTWETREQPDLMPLAEELVEDPDLLAKHWPWLTSGEAGNGWLLGEALAHADAEESLADLLSYLPGRGYDLRLLCEYVRVKRNVLGDVWFNNWVERMIRQDQEPALLLFEVTYRCGATGFSASKVAEMLQSKQISSQIARMLLYGAWQELLTADELGNVLHALIDTGHQDTAIGVLEHRIRAFPHELERWSLMALQLVTSSDLIRSSQMTSYAWKEVAKALIPVHAVTIASGILREHAARNNSHWLLEFSEAEVILKACVVQAPSEVWKAIQPYLLSDEAYKFYLGFPRGVVDKIPIEDVLAWISEKTDDRAVLISGLVVMDLSNDETLASRVVGLFGNRERVAGSFFTNFLAGSWIGPASAHWHKLAKELEVISRRTSLPKLRDWAMESARLLYKMGDRDRQREDEEEVRGW